MPFDKHIKVGVTEEEFRLLDDARHAKRITWQKLGHRLFLAWLSGDKKPTPHLNSEPGPLGNDLTSEELRLARALIAMLRDNSPDTGRRAVVLALEDHSKNASKKEAKIVTRKRWFLRFSPQG